MWWLEVLLSLELARQLNYWAQERSAIWYEFNRGIFESIASVTGRMGAWTRYRFGRLLRIILWLVIISAILGALYHTPPTEALVHVPATLYKVAPLLFELVFAMMFMAVQFIGLFWLLSKGGVEVHYPGDVKTRFSDVWGQDVVVQRVKENLIFLRDPDRIESKGGYVPGGILLHGPPGTGKTLLAEAVAGETHNPFVFVDPGFSTNMFMGVGILKVKSLFRKLRKLALRYGGVVVFFDEADSLGSRGRMPGPFGPPGVRDSNCVAYLHDPQVAIASPVHENREQRTWVNRMMMGGMMGGGGQGTLQAMLSEMQGMTKPRGWFNRSGRRLLGMRPKPPPKYRILIIMATNMPNSLDEAMLRPGRIDRIYKMGYPSNSGRIRTYQGYLSKVKNEVTREHIERLAVMTPYATGATIKDLVNESLIIAIGRGSDTITYADLLKAKQLKELGPPEDVEYVQQERHAVAIHEACHAVVAARQTGGLLIDMATIEKGAAFLGMVKRVRAEDTFTQWRSDYENDVMVSLASLVGERMFFDGDSASGVSGDLSAATRVATFMEGYWGMGTTLSSHEVTKEAGVGGGGGGKGKEDEATEKLLASLGDRIEANLERLYAKTEQILAASENRQSVLAVAHALESNKSVTGQDIMAITEGTQGPFIDGALYRTAYAQKKLESYHAAVLAAHIARQPAGVELPSLADLRP